VQPGFIISGKYELIAPLGEGGMGIVWRALHVGLGREVAVKLIHHDVLDANSIERFLREARNAAAVRHPNVLDVTDVGRTDRGEPYLVMELLDGESLGARLSRGPMSVTEVVSIGAGILRGLAAVHTAGLLHRDLKPDNVFLAQIAGETVVKLVDFGISKNVEDPAARAKLTQTGTIVGTPHYMSVEQLCGARDIDARSDLFSVGVILYEALARQLPHDGDSLTAVIAAKLEREPDALAVLRPDIPSALCAVVDRALARKRERRFTTAGQMRDALLAVGSPAATTSPVAQTVAGFAPTVRSVPTPVATTKPLTPMTVPAPVPALSGGRSATLWLSVVVLGVLGLAAAGGGLLWLKLERSDEPPDAPTVTALAPVPPAAASPVIDSSGWTIGPAADLAALAVSWRGLGAGTARDSVRFLPAGVGVYAPALPADADEATASSLALAFGGAAARGPAPTADSLAPVLLWTTGSLHVRAGATASAADVSALQAHVVLVGLRGVIDGALSGTNARTDWCYVVVDAHEAGWSSASYLELYSRCMPALGPFLMELPEGRRSTLAPDVSVRAIPTLLVGLRRRLAYMLAVHDPVDQRSYVGVYAGARDCTLEKLGVYRQDHPVENVYFVDASPATGPTLTVLRGPVLDSRFEGAELWQAFLLGGSDEVWRAVLPSAETVLWADRARVSFGETSRYGLPGHWPVRVRFGETEQFYRWDGTALALDP
jgi:serine/threonine-protein kinase